MSFLSRLFRSNRHEHNYVIPMNVEGCRFLKCDHPGCNCCDVHPEQEAEDRRKFKEIMDKIEEHKKWRESLNYEN